MPVEVVSECRDYNQSCPHQGQCNSSDQLTTAQAPAPTPDTDPGAEAGARWRDKWFCNDVSESVGEHVGT